MSLLAEAMPARVGRRFDRYEILQKLGAGGMGDVYRARDVELGREVAIKFLPARFASDPARLARFGQEARFASSLSHPNIVTVHEVGQLEGVPYIVMELVEGRTLRQLLTGRPLPTRTALDLAGQVAEGLAKAHSAGIVHRDLKPENVMVTGDGYVKIVDFGLAKLKVTELPSDAETPASLVEAPTLSTGPDRPASTKAGTLIGTVGYMSPEQALGRAADFRADQFSWGLIAYEMMAGRRAFHRASAVETLAAIIEEEPLSLALLNPSVPPPLRWIIERCLTKEPTGRYASTLDLARELREVREHLGEVAPARPPPVTGRGRRGRALIALAAVLTVAASAFFLPRRASLKHVAVLPFACSGGEPVDDAFCGGLQDQLAVDLTAVEQLQGPLQVVPVTEVRDRKIASAAAARTAFGATHVLSGSVRREGPGIRITAVLTDARRLRQAGAVSFELPVRTLSTLQSRLSDSVMGMIEIRLREPVREVLAAGQTAVPGAFELYLRGRGELAEYASEQSLDRAIEMFRRALALDSGYALAHAGLGEGLWRKYELTRDPALVGEAESACERALTRSPLLSPVFVTLGLLHAGTGHPDLALADFRQALALNPANTDAHRAMGAAYAALGEPGKAEAAYREAIRLKPDYWAGYSHLGAFFHGQGRYPEAEAQFLIVTQLAPGNVRGWSNLGAVQHLRGRDEEAETALRKARELQPTGPVLNNLATVQFYRGRYAAAAETLEEAARRAEHDPSVRRSLAAAYHWAGENAKARATYAAAAALARDALQINPADAGLLAELADCEAMLGDVEAARASAARALQLAPGNTTVMFRVGSVYEEVGDREQAVSWIGRALAAGYSRPEVERDPGLRSLRADPRFTKATSSKVAP